MATTGADMGDLHIQCFPGGHNEKINLILLGLAVAFLLYRLGLAAGNGFYRQGARKKITKAAETIERGVVSFRTEVGAYRTALEAFIADYADRPENFAPAFERFKASITRLALPKFDPEKFQAIKTLSFFHRDTDLYYRAFYQAVMLSGFCNLYREFFALDNWHHVEAVQSLVANLYHATPLKAHADFIMQKSTRQDADHAVHYFEAYGRLVDQALTHANALQADLTLIKGQNRYNKWLAGPD